jgi:hypothetical protein
MREFQMRRLPTLLLVALVGASCRDNPTEPVPATSHQSPVASRTSSLSPVTGSSATIPHFLRAAAGAPSIANPVIKFYAKKGQGRTVFMMYHAKAGRTDSTDLIRFRVGKNSLLTRPNGTPISPGDSVLITLKLADSVRLIVDFQPAGLQFNPQDPAELRIHWSKTNPDLNRDGLVNQLDAALEQKLKIWCRENSLTPWFPTPSLLNLLAQTSEVGLTGFTRYAVAY